MMQCWIGNIGEKLHDSVFNLSFVIVSSGMHLQSSLHNDNDDDDDDDIILLLYDDDDDEFWINLTSILECTRKERKEA